MNSYMSNYIMFLQLYEYLYNYTSLYLSLINEYLF